MSNNLNDIISENSNCYRDSAGNSSNLHNSGSNGRHKSWKKQWRKLIFIQAKAFPILSLLRSNFSSSIIHSQSRHYISLQKISNWSTRHTFQSPPHFKKKFMKQYIKGCYPAPRVLKNWHLPINGESGIIIREKSAIKAQLMIWNQNQIQVPILIRKSSNLQKSIYNSERVNEYESLSVDIP
jgi:hypothetical protein